METVPLVEELSGNTMYRDGSKIEYPFVFALETK